MSLYGFNSKETIKRVVDATKRVEGFQSGSSIFSAGEDVLIARITAVIDPMTSGSGEWEIEAEQVVPKLDGTDALSFITPSEPVLWDSAERATNIKAQYNIRCLPDQKAPPVGAIIYPFEGALNQDSASSENFLWFFVYLEVRSEVVMGKSLSDQAGAATATLDLYFDGADETATDTGVTVNNLNQIALTTGQWVTVVNSKDSQGFFFAEIAGAGESECMEVVFDNSCFKIGKWMQPGMVVARVNTVPDNVPGTWTIEGTPSLIAQLEIVDNAEETDNAACVIVKDPGGSLAALPDQDENMAAIDYVLVAVFTPTDCVP